LLLRIFNAIALPFPGSYRPVSGFLSLL